MKIRNIFLILASLFSIDFFLTVIALNFREGLFESNPIPRWFFGFGIFGYIVFFILSMFLIFLLSVFIYKLSWNKYNKKPGLTERVGILSFCILEGYVIINNLYWLI